MAMKPPADTTGRSKKAPSRPVRKSTQTIEKPAKTLTKPAKTTEKPAKPAARATVKDPDKSTKTAAKTPAKPKITPVKTPVKAKKPEKTVETDIETRLEKAPREAVEETALEVRVRGVCALLSAKKAESIKVIHVEKITSLADYFIICSGRNVQQTKAIYDNLTEKCEEIGIEVRRSEGEKEGRWVAVDLGEIIVHIFNSEAREFYQLDKLWSNGTNIYEYTD